MTNWILGILAATLVIWQVRPIFGVRRVGPRELGRWLTEGRALEIVDLRSAEEFAIDHLPGARLIPLEELRQRSGELDRERATVLVARTQYRAMQAYHILRRRRFTALHVLRGGMLAWELERIGRDGNGE